MSSDPTTRQSESDETGTDSDPPSVIGLAHVSASIFLTLFAVVSLAGLTRLSFDDDLENLFRGDTKEFRDFKMSGELFGPQDDHCIVLLSCDDVLSPSALQRIRAIDCEIHGIESVTDINSLCHLLSAKRIGRLFLPVLPFLGAPQTAWLKASQELQAHPLGTGLIFSNDRKATLVTFRFQAEISEEDQEKTLGKVRKVLEQLWESAEDSAGAESANGRKYGMSGLPLLRKEVLSNLMRDQQKFTWLGLLFALIIGWFVFRKPLPVFFVALVPFLALGCIMGWLGWFGIQLNIVNNVVTPLVLVIGFAEVIHILFLTGGFLGQGQSYRQAVISMVRQLFVPCLLAALTTAIGFGSLYLSSDKSLKEFAVVAAVASLVMFWMVLGTSGCLLATPLARFCVRDAPKEVMKNRKSAIRRIGILPIASVAFLSIVALALAAVLASRNHADFRFTENLPESNSAVTTLRQIDRSFGGSSSDQVILQFGEKPTPVKLIETLKFVRSEISTIDDVGRTTSFLDLLDSLPPKGGTDLEHFQELRYLPKETWQHFLRLNPTVARIQLSLPDIGSHRLHPVIADIQEKLNQIESRFEGVEATFTGLNVLSASRSQKMIGDLTFSLIGASVAIFLLILVTYRSLGFSVAAIIVNAIPILGVAAIMYWTGQSIQYTGIMLLCVCLGLAVDDTVHFFSKLKYELKFGIDFELAVVESVKKLWPVFLTTSLMLGVGFGLAATSEIPTFQTFGGFACVALFLALVSDLLVLPCLLILIHRMFCKATEAN